MAESSMLTISEAARESKTSPYWIRESIYSGKLPAIKSADQKWLIARADLNKWLERPTARRRPAESRT